RYSCVFRIASVIATSESMECRKRPCAIGVGGHLKHCAGIVTASERGRAVQPALRIEGDRRPGSCSIAPAEVVENIFRPATVHVGSHLENGTASVITTYLCPAGGCSPVEVFLCVHDQPGVHPKSVRVSVTSAEVVQYFVVLGPG